MIVTGTAHVIGLQTAYKREWMHKNTPVWHLDHATPDVLTAVLSPSSSTNDKFITEYVYIVTVNHNSKFKDVLRLFISYEFDTGLCIAI